MAKGFAPNQGPHYADGIIWLGLSLQRSIRPNAVTVGASPTKIPTSPLSKRKTLLIMNISTNIVYIGNSAVTTSNGFPIYPRGVLHISIEDNVDIYGIASGNSACRILEGA